MRIGKWTFRLVRRAITIEHAPKFWSNQYGVGNTSHDWPNPIVDMHKHCSTEDIKRWQDEIGKHLGGAGLGTATGDKGASDEHKEAGGGDGRSTRM